MEELDSEAASSAKWKAEVKYDPSTGKVTPSASLSW